VPKVYLTHKEKLVIAEVFIKLKGDSGDPCIRRDDNLRRDDIARRRFSSLLRLFEEVELVRPAVFIKSRRDSGEGCLKTIPLYSSRV
jgi:hypothetical protein